MKGSTETPKAASQKGALIIVGGAEDREGKCLILREFVRLAGGTDAKIAVLTAATSAPREVGDMYTDIFKRLGVEHIEVVDTRAREDAEDREMIQAIQGATGIFFSGGDQAKIVESIKGTPLDAAIRERHEQGAVVGGTSAGAAMMPDTMIIEGDSTTNPRPEVVELGPGMGFLPGVVIDQHFAQRGRLGRLLAALLLQPTMLGFGIDEDTAMVVQGQEFHVVGNGTITVIDESESSHNNVDHALKDEDLAVFGVKLHILPNGYRFNLNNRQPIAPGA